MLYTSPQDLRAGPAVQPSATVIERAVVARESAAHSLCIQRNCSASPRLLLTVLGVLSMVSLLIGIAFWFMNAPWVLFFSGVEVLAVGVAFVVHARSATDSDTLVWTANSLQISQERRGQIQHFIFNRSFVRVGMTEGLDPLIEIGSAGQWARLGQGWRPAVRRAVCRQLHKDMTTESAQRCVHNLQVVLSGAGVRAVRRA